MLRHAFRTNIGDKRENQDTFLWAPNFLPQKQRQRHREQRQPTPFGGSADLPGRAQPRPLSFQLVMIDGHGPAGLAASEFIRDNLKQGIPHAWQIAATAATSSVPLAAATGGRASGGGAPVPTRGAVDALQSAFVAADAALGAAAHIDTQRSGATCTAVVLERGRLAVACVGDCRCVLGKVETEGDDTNTAFPFVMTRDHRPELDDERARVEACGARIDHIRAPDGSARGPLRVWLHGADAPGLMVTRSVGDGVASSIGVTAVPEVFVVPLERTVRFLVVATDGIWDMLSNEEVVEMVCRHLHEPETACNALVAAASAKWRATIGHADNITVGVLVFDTCPAYD